MNSGIATLMKTVHNGDSRFMQSLPWKLRQEEACTDMVSHSRKHIATFWGNDERLEKNFEWPTQDQRERHAQYAVHACNNFPLILETMEKIYMMEDMPEEAIKAIEGAMEKAYTAEVPPYAR